MTYTSLHASANHPHSGSRISHLWSARGPQSSLTMLIAAVVVATLAAGAFSPIVLHAQVAGFGTIAGTVLDPSGAVVAGASVTAVNTATGLKFTQQTSGSGTYTITALPAGEYRVDVLATGFGREVHEHVTVNALSQVGLNISLHVGSATQEVVVTEAPPDLQTENGTVETTIPNSTYSALPIAMNGGPKSPLGFISLVPGMGVDPIFGTPVMNGGFQESSQIYVNGLPLADPELQGGSGDLAMTSTEVIDQFQVLTSGIPANYDGQGIVNLVLKSGTNHIHGSVYENIRNTAFDAKGFFTHGPTPIEHQNEYGFTIGGPVLHDRIFYFGSYDGFKITHGSNPQFVTIPTVAERTGDFSAFPAPIYDPASTTCNGGVCTRTQFPGNIIPANRLSSVANNFQSYLPDPLNSNIANNFFNTYTSGNTNHMYLTKVDANVTNNNHASVLFQKGTSGQLGLQSVLPLPYAANSLGTSTYYAGQISDTQVITPNLLNVFGAQYYRSVGLTSNPTESGDYPSKAGFTGLPAGPPSTTFPRVIFSGPNAPYLWGPFGGSGFGIVTNAFTYQDNVHWTHGKHSMTFGGQVLLQQINLARGSGFNGLNFSNTETAAFNPDGSINASTGNAYASYLLGLVDSSSARDTAIQETGGRWKNYALYAQDDWKVTPKLTLNFGLRYTIPKPFVEAQDRWSWFDPTAPNPAAGGAPGMMVSAGNGPGSCHCSTNVKTHYLTFGPRFGFAYAVNTKTVVRSSFAMVHFNGGALGGNGDQQGVGNLGYATANPSFTSPDGGISPAFLLDNGFPAYTRPAIGSFDSTINTGFTVANPQGGGYVFDRPATAGRAPYTEEWNFNIERELPGSMTLSLGYDGTSSHFDGVQGGVGIYSDQVNPKYLALGNLLNQPESPVTLAQAQAQFPEITLPFRNFVGSIGQMLRPFPQYNGAGASFEGPDPWANFGTSSYNSFEARLSRRMTNGLYFLASYTWSKLFDDGGNTVQFFSQTLRSAYNVHAERSVSSFDRPHVFSLSEVYLLPFGKGRRFSSDNGAFNAVLGGWQISGIEQYSSGTPLGSIFGACNNPYMGGVVVAIPSASCYADYNSAFSGNVRTGSIGSGTPGVTSYLNANAFQNAQPFTFGNTPRTLAYSSLRNQWAMNESVSITKTFPIKENVSFQFKADAFNVFNRSQFGGIGTDITSSTFGQVSGQSNTPRQLQFEGIVRF
jgi:hypothetical protein